MAGAKQRGIITQHMARYHNDREIKPCRYIAKGRGKGIMVAQYKDCLLYTSPSPRDQRGSRMPSSA